MKHSLIATHLFKEYSRIDEPLTFEEFLDLYADGKREGSGLESRTVGNTADAKLFWFDEDEFPFGYIFVRQIVDGKYIFYIRQK